MGKNCANYKYLADVTGSSECDWLTGVWFMRSFGVNEWSCRSLHDDSVCTCNVPPSLVKVPRLLTWLTCYVLLDLLLRGQVVQHIVQELQSSVKSDLDPTWRLLDALPAVVWPPTLHKAQPQDAQATQVIHSNTFSHVGINADIAPTQVAYRTHTEKENLISAKLCIL